MADDIIARSMPLVFAQPCGPRKWYAQTPAGELAYSDSQGLYEWRRLDRTEPSRTPGLPPMPVLVRIQYSGGDRQASRDGQMLHQGPESPGRDTSVRPYPHAHGCGRPGEDELNG